MNEFLINEAMSNGEEQDMNTKSKKKKTPTVEILISPKNQKNNQFNQALNQA